MLAHPGPSSLHSHLCPLEEVTQPGSRGGLLLRRFCPAVSEIRPYVHETSAAPWPWPRMYTLLEDPYLLPKGLTSLRSLTEACLLCASLLPKASIPEHLLVYLL